MSKVLRGVLFMSFLGIEEAHWKNVANLRNESTDVLVAGACRELHEALNGVEGQIRYIRSELSRAEEVLQRLAPVPWWNFASWIVRHTMRPYWKRRHSYLLGCLKGWEDYSEHLKIGIKADKNKDLQTIGETLKGASLHINIWENAGVFVPNLSSGIKQMFMANRADEILQRIKTQTV